MSPTIPQFYIIYSNVTGKPATEVEFIERLKRFSSSALLRVCSVLNMVLTQWVDGYDEESHARLVHTFVHPTLATLCLRRADPYSTATNFCLSPKKRFDIAQLPARAPCPCRRPRKREVSF